MESGRQTVDRQGLTKGRIRPHITYIPHASNPASRMAKRFSVAVATMVILGTVVRSYAVEVLDTINVRQRLRRPQNCPGTRRIHLASIVSLRLTLEPGTVLPCDVVLIPLVLDVMPTIWHGLRILNTKFLMLRSLHLRLPQQVMQIVATQTNLHANI